VRYSAIRGESLEPGGCSAWPTSPAAAWTAVEEPNAGAGAAAAVPITDENGCAAAGAAAAAGGALGAAGRRPRWISSILVMTASTLIDPGDRTVAADL
jgi:hypothetical protein